MLPDGRGSPARREFLAAGLIALVLGWLIAAGLYLLLVDFHPPPLTGLTARAGPVSCATFGAVLTLIGVWLVWFFLAWRGWPFSSIRRRGVRWAAGNAATIGGGLLTFLLLDAVSDLRPATITAAAGALIAAGSRSRCCSKAWDAAAAEPWLVIVALAAVLFGGVHRARGSLHLDPSRAGGSGGRCRLQRAQPLGDLARRGRCRWPVGPRPARDSASEIAAQTAGSDRCRCSPARSARGNRSTPRTEPLCPGYESRTARRGSEEARRADADRSRLISSQDQFGSAASPRSTVDNLAPACRSMARSTDTVQGSLGAPRRWRGRPSGSRRCSWLRSWACRNAQLADVRRPPDLTMAQQYWTPRQLVEMALSAPDRLEPDTAYRVLNTDFILLGMIIEAATGQSVEAAAHPAGVRAAGPTRHEHLPRSTRGSGGRTRPGTYGLRLGTPYS